MKNLTYKITENEIQVTVQEEAVDQFRKVFKTANYNSSNKIWTLNNSKTSLNKLKKLIETSNAQEVETKIKSETIKEGSKTCKGEIIEYIKQRVNSYKEDNFSLFPFSLFLIIFLTSFIQGDLLLFHDTSLLSFNTELSVTESYYALIKIVSFFIFITFLTIEILSVPILTKYVLPYVEYLFLLLPLVFLFEISASALRLLSL